MPAGLASLVLQAQALVSVLLAAALLGERPGRGQTLGALVGSAGIGLLAIGGGARASLLGFGLTLFAAVSWAVANVIMRASGERRPLSLLVWSSLVPPLPLLGLATVVNGPAAVWRALSGLTLTGALAIGYIAYVSTLVGFGLWNRLISRYSVTRVAPFSLLVPVFGLAAAGLALHERPSVGELLAALVVLAGLALVVRRSPAAPSGGSGQGLPPQPPAHRAEPGGERLAHQRVPEAQPLPRLQQDAAPAGDVEPVELGR